MKVSAFACAAIVGLALAGCTNPQPAPQAASQTPQAPRSFDTGNMAYPTPPPQGNLETTSVGRQPADTGNMAYPASRSQGNLETSTVGRRSRPTDTGNMAYPAPLPQGRVGTTQTQ